MDWEPATKSEVLVALAKDWVGIEPDLRHRLSAYLIDPKSAEIERSGQIERAFVVARIGRYVVSFDDVEEIFGTAELDGGRLHNAAWYGPALLALQELERLTR
ncbi:hypothetical protein [Sphingosinicella sp. BN140058]|uniref:hypothetical protein n=1 Tax=Sphingosinicella sp. BN140058 TaxID=1892855 RepID=UPI001012B74D|nr:hypothetical protein [Sphingosinicella sp. BN140058]QAY78154.1 hypothetical protein ETR14_17690 [Sphingosinicella sp. BN140058]